eukprot:SAG31_NODE_442_length_15661_cov_4.132245_13_plen_75_part_00
MWFEFLVVISSDGRVVAKNVVVGQIDDIVVRVVAEVYKALDVLKKASCRREQIYENLYSICESGSTQPDASWPL